MRPLEGMLVLDLSRYIPGPFCTQILADYGARVITVEDPRGGDPGRLLPPQVDGTGFAYAAFHRGTESLALDTRTPEGVAILRTLAGKADVLVESFRPGTLDRAGLGYAALAAVNPRLIYLSLTGYGQTGPLRDAPGHDLNFEAQAGLLHPPHMPPFPAADMTGGYRAALAVLAAVLERARTGRGRHLDVALQDAAFETNLLNLTRARAPPTPESSGREITGGLPAYNLYATQDGKWLALGALEPKFWTAFVKASGRDELHPDGFALDDPEARARVQAAIAERPLAEWLSLLAPAGVPATAANNAAEVLRDPYLAARLPHLATPTPAPALGAHTNAILTRDAGLSPREVDALIQQGIALAATR